MGKLQCGPPQRPGEVARGPSQDQSAQQEYRKASIRAKVEHPFRVIKCQFGLVKVRFKGLTKNTVHVTPCLRCQSVDGAQEANGDDGTGASPNSLRALDEGLPSLIWGIWRRDSSPCTPLAFIARQLVTCSDLH